MKHPIAVLDLGTNTFHLLISRPRANGFEEIFRERRFVKLAENGIDRIHETPFQRGLEALGYFRERLDEYGVQKLKAFGTAALRTASNRQEFIEQAWEKYRIKVELISGEEEARLIQLGVAQAVPSRLENDLIMDIGGGSVEFIIANSAEIIWSASFPVGVAVLYKKFQHHDPILPEELTALNQFLFRTLQPLVEALAQSPCTRLIGASGTFDVLENLAPVKNIHPLYSEIPLVLFPKIYDQLIHSTLTDRQCLKGIPPERAEMIVVAMELLRWVITESEVTDLAISSYAMKEGIMAELLAESES